MAVTTNEVGRTPSGNRLLRHVETSAADTILAMSVKGGSGRKVLAVTVAYSAAPTQAGVTTKLDSGAGAGYDSTLNTGSANAQFTNYLPDGELIIGNDDALVVTAPAAGGVITSSIAVYTEEK